MMRPNWTAALALVALALTLPAPAPAVAEERTLEEVEIEGEVRLPQVLFITSRDSDRPLDWLGAYQPATAATVALDAYRPARIHVAPLGIPALLDLADASQLELTGLSERNCCAGDHAECNDHRDFTSRANEEDLR